MQDQPINIDHYVKLDRNNPERTRKRLQQIVDIGMEEIGIASFGYQNIMSGLYIERVWNDSDNYWDSYIAWAEGLIKNSKLPT